MAKETDHRYFVMYPWTLSELRVCSRLLGRDATSDEKAFEVCGGSLRLGGAREALEELQAAHAYRALCCCPVPCTHYICYAYKYAMCVTCFHTVAHPKHHVTQVCEAWKARTKEHGKHLY